MYSHDFRWCQIPRSTLERVRSYKFARWSMLRFLAHVLNCKVGALPTTYLGDLGIFNAKFANKFHCICMFIRNCTMN